MELTGGFALQTTNGKHIGFVLGAPSFQAECGDCVFILVPATAEGLDTPLGRAISELKLAGEHRWQKRNGNIEVLGATRSLLTISATGQVLDADGAEIGRAIPLPGKE
jgi:hypothetical protein